MPTRSSRSNSGALASPAQDNRKRALDNTHESTLSPRRSKRTRSIVDNSPAKPDPSPPSQTSRKPRRQVSANSKSSVAAVDIKEEEELIEGDDIKAPIHIKKQTLSITAQDSDIKVKEEVEIEIEEEDITATKSTKKRKTKAEKESEMLPLAARTKGLQMFVGAHVSAAKGWSILFKYHFKSLNIGQGYRTLSSTVCI